MSEKVNITCNIKNLSGNILTVYDSNLDAGKFQTNPIQVEDETIGEFKASGRKGSANGTHGYVTYQAFDGTLFTINFYIRWGTKANSISSSVTTDNGIGNPSHFNFYRTASDYVTKETDGDPGESPVVVYYYLAKRDDLLKTKKEKNGREHKHNL
ncbi:MAG TPA: hypothetical protein VLL98_03430 [Rickettsiales bacterium]|nr:hypothetical protein [Rickettsiales bacterium]